MDVCVTALAWTYFTLGWLLCFAPLYVAARLLPIDRQSTYQALNHYFYRGFFKLITTVTPGLKIEQLAPIRDIRGAIIVANHLSYLDPLLFIALYRRHKTIVKSLFFKLPIFGAVIKTAGYLPSQTSPGNAAYMLRQVESLPQFIDQGGNLFVFPEGTRRGKDKSVPFHKGVLRLAKRCRAPVAIVAIDNTHRLFAPGRFRFHTCRPNTLRLECLKIIHPDYDHPDFSLQTLAAQVQRYLIETIT